MRICIEDRKFTTYFLKELYWLLATVISFIKCYALNDKFMKIAMRWQNEIWCHFCIVCFIFFVRNMFYNIYIMYLFNTDICVSHMQKQF